MEERTTTLLVVILDGHAKYWGESCKEDIQFSECVSHIMQFLNSFKLLHPNPGNLAVIAADPIHVAFLSQPTSHEETGTAIQEKIFAELHKFLLTSLNQTPDQHHEHTKLAQAFTQALCFIHKKQLSTSSQNLSARILLVQKSPASAASQQYLPLMNCVFAAQRKKVVIDACILHHADSTFLQQATHLTHGTYITPKKQRALIQYLLAAFLPTPTTTRSYLPTPQRQTIDFRATCFCHKKVIALGFVCSACLAIFCSRKESTAGKGKCRVCGTELKEQKSKT